MRTASKNKNISACVNNYTNFNGNNNFGLTSGFSQSNLRLNTETIINQIPKQSSLPASVTGINETNSLNKTNLINNSSSAPLNTNPISLDT